MQIQSWVERLGPTPRLYEVEPVTTQETPFSRMYQTEVESQRHSNPPENKKPDDPHARDSHEPDRPAGAEKERRDTGAEGAGKRKAGDTGAPRSARAENTNAKGDAAEKQPESGDRDGLQAARKVRKSSMGQSEGVSEGQEGKPSAGNDAMDGAGTRGNRKTGSIIRDEASPPKVKAPGLEEKLEAKADSDLPPSVRKPDNHGSQISPSSQVSKNGGKALPVPERESGLQEDAARSQQGVTQPEQILAHQEMPPSRISQNTRGDAGSVTPDASREPIQSHILQTKKTDAPIQPKVSVLDLRTASGRLKALRQEIRFGAGVGTNMRSGMSPSSPRLPMETQGIGMTRGGLGQLGTPVIPGQQAAVSFEGNFGSPVVPEANTGVLGESLIPLRGWMSAGQETVLKGQPKSPMDRLWGRGISEAALTDSSRQDSSLLSREATSRERSVNQVQQSVVQNQPGHAAPGTLGTNIADPESAKQAFTSYLQGAGAYDLVRSAKFVLKDDNRGEIKLILKPEELGEVKISLFLTDNRIEGSVSVENEGVQQAFSQSMESLRKAFAESGFDVLGFDVVVGDAPEKKGEEPRIAQTGNTQEPYTMQINLQV
ncbi:flagellar hook-length control protein FliK [Spirochaeta lutea]|nr:flagellar hook-length control protein FliK [Spirochaeta lutea]